MKFDLDDYQVSDGQHFKLKKFATHPGQGHAKWKFDEDEAEDELRRNNKQLAKCQELLYAQNQWSLLIVLQGMDTAGKDGLIEHVMHGVNPIGCEVANFKKPTIHELEHDFLWRTHLRLPARGNIGIFNRSYYEDVVVPYVHPQVVRDSQLPDRDRKVEKILKERYVDIVNHEAYLSRQGVKILKFFLHLSKDEQKRRLIKRLEDPEKNWKLEASDLHERGFWSKYQEAYQRAIAATATEVAPWHILPADEKPITRLLASRVILQALESLDLRTPKLGVKQRAELRTMRAQL